MPTVGKRRGRRALYGLALGAVSLTAQGVAPSYAEDCRYFSALPDDCARAAVEPRKNAPAPAATPRVTAIRPPDLAPTSTARRTRTH